MKHCPMHTLGRALRNALSATALAACSDNLVQPDASISDTGGDNLASPDAAQMATDSNADDDGSTTPDDIASSEDAPTTDADTASEARPSNLRTTADVRWALHGGRLVSGRMTFAVSTRFAPGSNARSHIVEAAAWYTDPAADVGLTVVEAPPMSVAELFPSEAPTVARMDYLDTRAADYGGFPCHRQPDDVSCGSWVMNMCPFWSSGDWGGGGTNPRQSFVISANAGCYGHASDATSGDYPKSHGVAHELGHGFGMIHTPDWPEADRGLLSTMQGRMPILTAYDLAFLRRKYPALDAPEVVDVAASPVSRLTMGSGYDNCPFGDFDGAPGMVADEVYVADGALLDCATGEPPKVAVTWFNLGTDPVPGLAVAFRMRRSSGGQPAILDAWTTAPMPRESQDHWAGPLVVPPDLLAAVPVDVPLRLEFAVDTGDGLEESDEDNNSVTAQMTVVASRAACRPRSGTRPCATLVP